MFRCIIRLAEAGRGMVREENEGGREVLTMSESSPPFVEVDFG